MKQATSYFLNFKFAVKGQNKMRLLGALASVAIVSTVTATSAISMPNDADAFHKTNKWDRRANLENGWVVFYSKEISHVEMLKIAAAIAADATVSGGGATTAYFGNFARESLAKLLSQAKSKSPQTFEVLKNNLTHSKLLSSIRSSFNGKEVGMKLAGLDIRVGRETYNRAECVPAIKECAHPSGWGIPCKKWITTPEKCVSTPNTYEPYIRIRK
jgi:hypothetical protein